jgi:hypothetical protein
MPIVRRVISQPKIKDKFYNICVKLTHNNIRKLIKLYNKYNCESQHSTNKYKLKHIKELWKHPYRQKYFEWIKQKEHKDSDVIESESYIRHYRKHKPMKWIMFNSGYCSFLWNSSYSRETRMIKHITKWDEMILSYIIKTFNWAERDLPF